jgi:nucleotide-binding universal stress UspA family protein
LLKIQKILLPLDLQETALPFAVIHQAAALAHHFHAEILLLHVVKPLTYIGTSDTTHELLEQAVAREQEKLKRCLGPQLEGLRVNRLVLKGNPAHEILRIAHDEKMDLIVMPTHGYGALERFLLGSVTLKVLHHSECPVWTGGQIKDAPDQQLAIRRVLCAVDFSPRSLKTARWAQDAATEFAAELTLAHVTPGVEIYGPGGHHVLSDMKTELVNSAMRKMEKLQQELGMKAAVFIGSGDVPKVMSQAAKETNADVIVAGFRPLGGRMGGTAYGIIRESPVPVLSV